VHLQQLSVLHQEKFQLPCRFRNHMLSVFPIPYTASSIAYYALHPLPAVQLSLKSYHLLFVRQPALKTLSVFH
jgi:hypothetical protein